MQLAEMCSTSKQSTRITKMKILDFIVVFSLDSLQFDSFKKAKKTSFLFSLNFVIL